MPSPNQAPQNFEEQTFRHQEVVQFNDGQFALGFRTPGDKLTLGYGSKHKYARNFDMSSMALIRTRSGNMYGIAKGLVIDKNRQLAFQLPEDDIEVTIGRPCNIPGVASTTEVESVLLQYKSSAPGDSFASHHVDAPSPFKVLDAQVRAVRNADN